MNQSLNSSPTDSHPHSAKDDKIYNSMVQIENGLSPVIGVDQNSDLRCQPLGNASIIDQDN